MPENSSIFEKMSTRAFHVYRFPNKFKTTVWLKLENLTKNLENFYIFPTAKDK